MLNGVLFWLLMLFGFYLAYLFGIRSAIARSVAAVPPATVPPETMADFESRLSPMLNVTGRKTQGDVIEFDGRLRGKAEEMFAKIRAAFVNDAVTPLLLEGDARNEARVIIAPGRRPAQAAERPKWWLHWLLFAATLATTTWVGALQAGVDPARQPRDIVAGLPYSVGLLLILGAHELGHYFTARVHGIRVTPPYFIPIPFALGTFGAFIKIKSITPNRRALFDVAVAGPLAGLVFAIPALWIGLRWSRLVPADSGMAPGYTGVSLGSSVLLAGLAKLSLGASMADGSRLLLHPLAFAGWLGLIVTALNLLPIGQLDGGHMSHALFGSRNAHGISLVALVSLFLLALFVWPGLMFWAFIAFFIAGTRDAPAANDITPLNPSRKLVGYLAFLLLLLIITPVPRALYQAMNFHSPYL